VDKSIVLKAIADDTRIKILELLLRHNYCVRALAKKLSLTEATISQHLKVLREAGLLEGEKRGYFMHYDVKRDVLHELAKEIEVSAQMERKPCEPDEHGNCAAGETQHCHKKAECSDEVKEFCHGKENVEGGGHHGNCHGHKS
jgi:ArsR family transcriptional regulator